MLPLHNKHAKSGLPTADARVPYGTKDRTTSLGNLGSTIPTQLANSPLSAEFLGAFAMTAIGTVVNCLFGLYSSNSDPWWRTFALGWGFASAIGGWITNSYEGCLNPAVVVASAVFGHMSWTKALEYISVQVSGAFCGSALAYGLFYSVLDTLEVGPGIRTVSGSAGFFAVFDPSRSSSSLFIWEFLGAFFIVVRLFDQHLRNAKGGPRGDTTRSFFWSASSASCLKVKYWYTCNPAQDFGSRMMLYAVGYGPEVWSHKGWYSWFLAPIVAPVLGGLLGAFTSAKINHPRKYASALHRLRKEAALILQFLTNSKVVWATIGLDFVFGAAIFLRLAAPEGKEQMSRWLSLAPGLYIEDRHVVGVYGLY
ncbi:hypothetical protein BOTBODRAFT_63650 [Botryobasidium botryosum FD-172 SS1]|uniref:Aquaporin n=1 Tax=Botryobasidium botryosum (strain FD-172 SS1) TaxID=930990 RepID=A0A067N194_BOTB1|nr:hypothetical protein BOTBODRAFT_63650 [Botryobasidium botryosum FD-172 SS1]